MNYEMQAITTLFNPRVPAASVDFHKELIPDLEKYINESTEPRKKNLAQILKDRLEREKMTRAKLVGILIIAMAIIANETALLNPVGRLYSYIKNYIVRVNGGINITGWENFEYYDEYTKQIEYATGLKELSVDEFLDLAIKKTQTQLDNLQIDDLHVTDIFCAMSLGFESEFMLANRMISFSHLYIEYDDGTLETSLANKNMRIKWHQLVINSKRYAHSTYLKRTPELIKQHDVVADGSVNLSPRL